MSKLEIKEALKNLDVERTIRITNAEKNTCWPRNNYTNHSIRKLSKNKFKIFSSGNNWRDQGAIEFTLTQVMRCVGRGFYIDVDADVETYGCV